MQQRLAAELEEELWQRAVYGVKIPKFYRGEVIGYEIRYSDTLLMTLLEARDPEKFGGIREELQRQSREDGLGVRWDRDEVARPTLPRMTGPMPPAPPRPPRPPMPSIAECGEPVTYAEWAAARGITGRDDCGPPDQEKLQRWAAGDGFSSVEWIPEEAAADFESEDADPEEKVADADGSGSDDSDVDFCVRWGAAEPDWLDDGSALPAPESVSADTTRPGRPGWETGWPFKPGERAGREGKPDCDGDLLRNAGLNHGENLATVGRFPVRKRLRRGLACHRGGPLHPKQVSGGAASRIPAIGVTASDAQTIGRRRAGPTGRGQSGHARSQSFQGVSHGGVFRAVLRDARARSSANPCEWWAQPTLPPGHRPLASQPT